MALPKKNAACFSFICLAILAVIASSAYSKETRATRHKALCSSYSAFTPCEAFVYPGPRLTANLPKGYLDVAASDLLQIDICDADVRCVPLDRKGLEFVWDKASISPFTAVVDFRVKYISESGRRKTAILRFLNRSAAEDFGRALMMSSMALTTDSDKRLVDQK